MFLTKPVTTVEEGVKKLLEICRQPVPAFELEPKKPGEYLDTLILEGKRIPLFHNHYESRAHSLAQYGEAKPEENSSLNAYSFMGKDVKIDELIYREMDLAEYFLHSKVEKVTAYVNGDAVNFIAVMESGACANLNIGCTMPSGAANECQHRIYTKHGMANDRSVGTMVTTHQLNIFSELSPATEIYDDDDHYLYGLDEDQTAKVIAIYTVIRNNKIAEGWDEADKRMKAAIKAIYKSAETGTTVTIKEVL